MGIIWLLSYSVSFRISTRSYVMSVVVCTCVCSCLKVRQSSIHGPSKMADQPSYRNKSSVHAPFSYITRRPGFVQTPPQESTHS